MPATVAASDDARALVVDALGLALDREAARAQLLALYAATEQLPAVSEATLRVDAELELLRRRCFAERNARWGFATPDALAPAPAVEPAWDPQPANDKLALLAAADAAARKPGALAASLAPAVPRPSLDGFPVGEYVRDRPWPPKEFGVKSIIKPIRSKGGKRKSAAAIIAAAAAAAAAAAQTPSSPFPRACVDCKTQSTPLWRSRVIKKMITVPVAVAPTIPGVTVLPDGTLQAANGSGVPTTTTRQQEVEEHLDLCMQCYLKTERKDLFERRKQDKSRKERDRRDRAAAEKKQLQQLKKQQKRQQQKQQQQEGQAVANPAASADSALNGQSGVVEAPVILKFTKDELDVALERNVLRKEKKKSHHDKKKKKKKKRKLEHYEDSDTDGLTPMPSPPQMARYEYADIAHSSFDESGSFEHQRVAVEEQPVVDSDADRSRSKRKRDSKTKRNDGGSSKKRRSTEGSAVESHPTVSIPLPVPTPTPSRSSRSKVVAAPTAPVVTPNSSKKKRSRGKKESDRERELRALGQYCPVCNEVYEDDDDSSFVCCDSCEMWVHTACDTTLTPAIVAALANPDEKYICPLCAGR